jgi:hypothetical protein
VAQRHEKAAAAAPAAASTTAAPIGDTTEQTKSVTLSDGRVAVVREGKGEDLMKALKLSSGDADAVQFSLAAVLTKIDGKAVIYEDFLLMKLPDCAAIMNVSMVFQAGSRT